MGWQCTRKEKKTNHFCFLEFQLSGYENKKKSFTCLYLCYGVKLQEERKLQKERRKKDAEERKKKERRRRKEEQQLSVTFNSWEVILHPLMGNEGVKYNKYIPQ